MSEIPGLTSATRLAIQRATGLIIPQEPQKFMDALLLLAFFDALEPISFEMLQFAVATRRE